MKRTRTTAERVLAACLAVIVAPWCLFLLFIALVFRGGNAGQTWALRGALLCFAALVAAGLPLLARSSLRRALARPEPHGGLNTWLRGQPGWRLALIIWASYIIGSAGVTLGISAAMRRWPPALLWPGMLAVGALVAVSQAAMQRVVVERRGRRGPDGIPGEGGAGTPGNAALGG